MSVQRTGLHCTSSSRMIVSRWSPLTMSLQHRRQRCDWQIEQRRIQSAHLYQLTKQQFEKVLSAEVSTATPSPQQIITSQADLCTRDSSQHSISLISYNTKYKLIADNQARHGYKFVPLQQPNLLRARINNASGSSTDTERVEGKGGNAITSCQAATTLPLVATPAVTAADVSTPQPSSTKLPSEELKSAADNQLPVVTMQVTSPSLVQVHVSPVDATKQRSNASDLNSNNLLLRPNRTTARPSSARSNASRRSTRSRRSHIVAKEQHWVDNITISDADDQNSLAKAKRRTKGLQREKSDGTSSDDIDPPSFICPNSQDKSHQYMCGLWILRTKFHCSMKTLPLA